MTLDRGSGLRAISFDAGDMLLFDDPPIERRIETALQASGLVYADSILPEAVRGMQRHGLSLYLNGLALDSPELVLECTQRLLASLRLDDSASSAGRLADQFAKAPFQRVVHPRALPLLTELKRRGFLLAVISDWEPDLPHLLQTLGIFDLLDCLSVSSLVGATKPSPKLFQHALQCLLVPACSVLHVGDFAELDAAGARGVGMSAVIFDQRGLYQAGQLKGEQLVSTFAELESMLLSFPAPAVTE